MQIAGDERTPIRNQVGHLFYKTAEIDTLDCDKRKDLGTKPRNHRRHSPTECFHFSFTFKTDINITTSIQHSLGFELGTLKQNCIF